MKILAIETSCDDTCVAVIEAKKGKSPRFNILSNIISSQIEIHKQYGGVYPSMAKREHQRNLVPVLKKAIKATNKEKKATTNEETKKNKTIEIINSKNITGP